MFRFGKQLPQPPAESEQAHDGEITAAIEAATNPLIAEVDWAALFHAADLIKALYHTDRPSRGCVEAMRTVRRRLGTDDPVAINYTLTALDALFRSCEHSFVVEVAQKVNLDFFLLFLERPDIVAENRGQCLDMIAEWAFITSDPPEIRAFFEKLLKSGYRFSRKVLSTFPPGVVERVVTTGVGSVFEGSIDAGRQSGPVHQQVAYNSQNLPTPKNSHKPSSHRRIDQVPFDERKKWVKFDCRVAENSVYVLLEAVGSVDMTLDISANEFAKECYGRCTEIQYRMAKSISRVAEPELVAKLLSASAAVNSALEQYNNHRIQYLMLNATAENAARNPLLTGSLLADDLSEGTNPLPPVPSNAATVPYNVWSGSASSVAPANGADRSSNTASYDPNEFANFKEYGFGGGPTAR
ncbi:hypothetical protein HDU78_008740 [Chytriomyces hyalinus]|nr:hypothetical protein HDU78_008740 [Chytriomyces hyalinus]